MGQLPTNGIHVRDQLVALLFHLHNDGDQVCGDDRLEAGLLVDAAPDSIPAVGSWPEVENRGPSRAGALSMLAALHAALPGSGCGYWQHAGGQHGPCRTHLHCDCKLRIALGDTRWNQSLGRSAHLAVPAPRNAAHARKAVVIAIPVAKGKTWTSATSVSPARHSASRTRKWQMRASRDDPAA
jgi:hypothetical protein